MKEYIKNIRKYIGNKLLLMCGPAVIIIDKNKRILLQHRTDNNTWGLPGGIIEPGETMEEAAIRETKEETGLTCKNLKLFNIYSGKQLQYEYPNGDKVYNVSIAYLCSKYSGKIKIDNIESKDVRFFKIKEIPKKILPPQKLIIEDIKKQLS